MPTRPLGSNTQCVAGHFHGDHTGGNAQFGADAPIIAHENVRKRLQEGGVVAGTEVKPASKEVLPVITFNDTATVHLNGEESGGQPWKMSITYAANRSKRTIP